MIETIITILFDGVSGYFIYRNLMLFMKMKMSHQKLFAIGLCVSFTANVLVKIAYDWMMNLSKLYGFSHVIANSMASCLVLVIYTRFIHRTSLRSYLFPLACAYSINNLIYLFSYSLSYQTLYPILNAIYTSRMNLYLVFLIPYAFIAALIAYLIKKYECYRLFEAIEKRQEPLWKLALYAMFIFFLPGILHELFGSPNPRSSYFITFGLITLLFTFLCVALMLRLHLEQEKARSMEHALAWQSTYQNTLEELQKEIRGFRHDYKNMISSLMLKSNREQIEADDLHELLLNFDDQIDRKMNIVQQMSNVGIIETKSLLMNKLTLIHNQKIPVTFEVLYPFDTIGMSTLDFNRCLGILMDNAIEAVQAHRGEISILFMKEEQVLHVTIENTVIEDIDVESMYAEGSSSKGEGRGIGLSSYQRIVDAYDNVYTTTLCQNHTMIQELHIEDN